jgi:cytochrome P450
LFPYRTPQNRDWPNTICSDQHSIANENVRFPRFSVWAREYGDIFSLKFGSGDTIVLCDRKAVHDLLSTKGAIFSDRPKMHLIDALGIDGNVFVSSLNNTWKEKRKIVSHNFSPSQLDKKHYRVQEAE